MPESVKVNLSEVQLKKLQKAINTGTDFSVRLGNDALQGVTDLIVNKVQKKKLEKNIVNGKGMVLKLSSNNLKELSKMISNESVIPNGKAPLKRTKGGAINPMIVLGIAQALVPIISPLIAPLMADLVYIISNPAAARFKHIYVDRIPNLNFRYDKIENTITFLKSKKKVPTQRIARLELRQNDIVSLIEKLITQLPILKQVAEQKDEQIKARQASQLDKQLTAALSKLESLQAKKDELPEYSEKGNGLQIAPGNGLQIAPGNGMQIGPPPRGSGLKKKP